MGQRHQKPAGTLNPCWADCTDHREACWESSHQTAAQLHRLAETSPQLVCIVKQTSLALQQNVDSQAKYSGVFFFLSIFTDLTEAQVRKLPFTHSETVSERRRGARRLTQEQHRRLLVNIKVRISLMYPAPPPPSLVTVKSCHTSC